jgi:tetraprenyl-beta-curcumene synthase
VEQELARWTYFAGKIPDPSLRQQALASIQLKSFHAQGGSIYSLYPEVTDQEGILRFIVAFQTISDYLDNLCDRAGVKNETAFRQLHLAMLDVANPKEELSDYYRDYPFQNDLGYLGLLVTECRTQLLNLPAYPIILKSLKNQIRLYTDLQALKHLNTDIRESRLIAWAKSYQKLYPQLSWWEFSAATGTTLGVFLLVAAAANPKLTPEEVTQIDTAYFPWIDGLHILLDYYIDAEEDRLMNDLNFTTFYQSQEQCQIRLAVFINQSLKSSAALSYPKFHQTIILGLLSMYLSDVKALSPQNQSTSKALLKEGGFTTQLYYHCCRLLRRLKKL